MKIAAINLGCPKNCVDLEVILGTIAKNGITIVEDVASAEVAIVNTCAFIQPAIKESLETIFEINKFKQGRLKKIVVTGCLPQRFGQYISSELPEADLIITNSNVRETCDKLVDYLGISVNNKENCNYQITPNHFAYIKISEGCSNCCTYCTIPLIKGRYKSYDSTSIIQNARERVEAGAKELIIVGQDTTNYGADLSNAVTIVSLIKKISRIEGIHWLRLMYAHPRHFSDDLLDLLAQENKLCHYLDIPIQHVSNRILAAMGRKLKNSDLYKLFSRLRTVIPDITIRSTVLVGFPGETEKEFQELLDFLEEVEFDRLGVFTYWQEEGTPAYSFPEQLSSAEKNDRQAEIIDLQANISLKKNRALIGKNIEIVIDRYDEKNSKYIGRTQWDSPEIDNEFILEDTAIIGQFYSAIVLDTDGFDLYGKRLDVA